MNERLRYSKPNFVLKSFINYGVLLNIKLNIFVFFFGSDTHYNVT